MLAAERLLHGAQGQSDGRTDAQCLRSSCFLSMGKSGQSCRLVVALALGAVTLVAAMPFLLWSKKKEKKSKKDKGKKLKKEKKRKKKKAKKKGNTSSESDYDNDDL